MPGRAVGHLTASSWPVEPFPAPLRARGTAHPRLRRSPAAGTGRRDLRAAPRLVLQNLVIAGTFITGLVLWDLLGHLPLPLGVAGHEGSTVLVGLNGLRLLRESAWRPGRVPSQGTRG